jgi:hypothetical protein
MAINYLSSINLNKNEIIEARIENVAGTTGITGAVAGQVIYDTTGEGGLKVYNGSVWKAVGKYDNLNLTVLSGTNNASLRLMEDTTVLDSALFQATIGGGISIGASGSTININHADTSSVSNSDNSNGVVLQDITFDTFGHVQTIGTVDLDSRYLQSISGGEGIVITGASSNVINVRYTESSSGALNNIIQEAPTGGTLAATNQILVNKTLTGTSNAAKVALNTIPLNFFAAATGDISLGGSSILNVADPTNAQDAATKQYVDDSVVGALVYQGGYNASTNSPDLTSSPNSIKKGWTYTVTSDGSFFGEQVRVGDVLISEANDPSALAAWTTVQNNIDLASASQVGIGNVAVSSTPALDGLQVQYSSGTATVGLDINSLTTETTFDQANTFLPVYTSIGSARNAKIKITDLATEISESNSASGTIAAASTSGTITHNLDSFDVIVQIFDNVTKETVYADVDRATVDTVVVTFGAAITNAVRVLVQKIS